ncbi:SDR family oxidoreductase [Spongiimicrobium sp. 3-5]|uniref:SDR family oxidoreductase n=1 Tax=Spongiimicrobium sp. 3-5 TaxID=3332596 RepID=UPI00397F7925
MSKGIVLVTGASKGIGAATAIALAREGYKVCINYKENKVAALQVQEKIAALGGNSIAVKADISQETDVVNLFQEIDDRLGEITGLVNNAAILGHKATLREMSAARLQNVFAINVFGTLLCCREAIKRMSIKNGGKGGSIVNISSIASRTGSPGEYVDYAATKGAIDTFTIGLAKEVGKENIRVNAIRPGHIQTTIHKSPERLKTLKNTVPLQRIGMPEEIAQTILWLLSEKSSYTSGAIIDVTGGK